MDIITEKKFVRGIEEKFYNSVEEFYDKELKSYGDLLEK
jgi:hypothetical protein